MAGLFRPLIRGSQQVGEPLATDRLAALSRQISKKSARLLRELPDAEIITFNHQRSKNADCESHRYCPHTQPDQKARLVVILRSEMKRSLSDALRRRNFGDKSIASQS